MCLSQRQRDMASRCATADYLRHEARIGRKEVSYYGCVIDIDTTFSAKVHG